MDLDALADLQLTYPEVGATAAAQLPPGYDHLSVSAQIGSGRVRFEQAADAVMRWGMQRGPAWALWRVPTWRRFRPSWWSR
ncbi:hypothetical protein I547_5193 [Mycobacterium kansasii 824]|nr:hypothetical protein I547_5193 [Mycobacterium kansasii 824]